MLAVEVRLLNGRYIAASFNDRTKPEWPMEPARLFSAAVASWAEAGRSADEREALQWWERQGAPAIVCSPDVEVAHRSTVTHYVPGNDATAVRSGLHSLANDLTEAEAAVRDAATPVTRTKAEKALSKLEAKAVAVSQAAGASGDPMELFPEERNKQARYYPSVTPESDLVLFRWSDAVPDAELLESLDRLLSRVGRIGHSSTLVSVRTGTATPSEPPSTYVPATGRRADRMIRVAVPDLLAELELAFEQHQGVEPRTMPAIFAPYVVAGAPRPEPRVSSAAGDWIVFGFDGTGPERAAFSINRVLELTRTLRSALIRHCSQPVPPVLSGHVGAGRNDNAHAMFLALPNAGSRYPDGSVTALAVSLPHDTADHDRQDIFDAVTRFVDDGLVLRWRGGRVARLAIPVFDAAGEYSSPPGALASRPYWARPSKTWTTVTPVALDRFPKTAKPGRPIDWEAFDTEVSLVLAQSCVRVGLPAPISVRSIPGSPMAGIPPVGSANVPGGRQFEFYRSSGSGQVRFAVHLTMVFEEPVRGPIVLGAGRHFGYGLFLPTREGQS